MEAIQYARKHLAPNAFPTPSNSFSNDVNNVNTNVEVDHPENTNVNNMKKIQQVMTAVALFPNHLYSNYKVTFAPYLIYPKELFSEQRWRDLEEKFKLELNEVYSLPAHSLLEINAQSGLIALKSTYCNEPENSNVNCPTCVPSIRILSKDLPFALHAHTVLICRISGDVMSDDNPPMVLPNGFAYSKNVGYPFFSHLARH